MPSLTVDPGHVLPTGTLTFLFTDIEGSTRLWEQFPEAMALAHACHGEIVARCVQAHGGHFVRVRGEGDSTFSVFTLPQEALAAATSLQRCLAAEPWPLPSPLRVRAALHTGTAVLSDGDYNSSDVNRCARLRALACGGQTLLSHLTYGLVCDAPPEGVRLQDLGTHRLKDLSRPERIYQALPPGLPADFPPLPSLDSRLTNLPAQMTTFIGREAAMNDVRRLLASHRLLTLTGPGGSGKTRLALQVAAEVVEEYPDGVWLVELAVLSDPLLLPQAVAQVLGVREEPGQTLPQTLARSLESKALLLVLDNCEHLLPACQGLAETLLHACPRLRLLLTSQQAPGIVGTARYPVPSLSLPSAGQSPDLDQLRDSEAVALFAERAAAVRASFVLNAANAPAVAQICRSLAGIPLALELAAAWMDVLTPDKIAARLGDRFHLLTRGNQAALPRHRTLRETIDWSYGLLSGPEKALLARLSVFAGGWTLEAAEAVCAGDVVGVESLEADALAAEDVLTLLSRLVDKSLVAAEPSETDTRYFLLETIRHYGQEKLIEAGIAEAFRLRHLEWCLSVAEDVEPHLQGADQSTYLTKLEQEHDNFRLVLDGFFGHEDPERHLRLTAALARFWLNRGHLSEGRRRLARALAGAASCGTTRSLAKALTGAGYLARAQGEYEAAHAFNEEALLCWRVLEDDSGIASTISNQGLLAMEQGDYASARGLYKESLEIRTEKKDTWGIAATLNNLGLVAWYEGDHQGARLLYDQSLILRRGLGDKQGVATSLNNLGSVAWDENDHPGAVSFWKQSLALFQELGDKPNTSIILFNLAHATSRSDGFAVAQAYYRDSLTMAQELGDLEGIAMVFENLVEVEQEGKCPERAARLAGAASALRQATGTLLPADHRAKYESLVEQVRSVLGGEMFAECFVSGTTLPAKDAVEFALNTCAAGG